MKLFLSYLCALLLFAATAHAQTAYPDLIVTNKGDTIRCSFKTITPVEIRYYMRSMDGPLQTSIPKSQVLYLDKGFYARREAPQGQAAAVQPRSYYHVDQPFKQPKLAADRRNYLKLEASYTVRSSWGRYNGVSLNQAFRRVKKGLLLSASFGHLFGKHLGLSARIEHWQTDRTNNTIQARLNTLGTYAGVDLMLRAPFDKAGGYVYALGGLGFLMYRDRISPLNNAPAFTVNGTGKPVRVGAGIHISLANWLAFDIAGHGYIGTEKSLAGETNLARLGVGGGLSFLF